ncbi:MAG TPA: RNA polymerase subunit alpha domain protein, partial [Pirellulales bacterium]
MALTATPVDVKSVVTGSSAFGPREVASLMDAIAIDPLQFRVLRDSVHELEQQPEPPPAMKVRLGVGSYLLGRYSKAAEYLAKAD